MTRDLPTLPTPAVPRPVRPRRGLRRAARAATTLLAGALVGSAAAQEVVIVGQPGVSYPDLQPAIDAAQPGDVLLLAGGSYGAATVTGKGLVLRAAHGDAVQVQGTLQIEDVPADQSVLVSGLDATGVTFTTPSGGGPALVVLGCDGPVHVEGGTFVGGAGFGGNYPGQVGGPAAYVINSPTTAFTDCVLRGGRGYDNSLVFDAVGGRGGTALTVQASAVALADCVVRGGRGGYGGIEGGEGGFGAWLSNAQMSQLGGVLSGGRGGDGLDFVYNCAGAGGNGLRTALGDRVVLHGVQLAGGAAGDSFLNLCGVAVPDGLAQVGAGAVLERPDGGRRLSAARLASDDAQVRVTITGQPGDLASVGHTGLPEFRLTRRGGWLLGGPPSPLLPVGVVPPSGTLEVWLPTFDAGLLGGALQVQAELRGTAGVRHLTNLVGVALLDRDAPEDWDGNGVNDLVDILEGTHPDCQPNFRVDGCDLALALELDCNGNGVPDSCDIASGTSFDLDGDGQPDECAFTPTTWHVDPSVPVVGDGSAQAPFRRIAQALAVADHYDVVLLAPGTYAHPSDLGQTIDRAITLRGSGGAAQTVLDGGGASPGLIVTNQGTPVHVEGLTVRNCATSHGAGLYANGPVRVLDCVFEDNVASARGGGLSVVGDMECEVRGCRFEGNQAASHGGAISCTYGSLTVVDCTFVGNTAGSYGGAIHLTTTPAVTGVHVAHSRFLGNESDHSGGALYAFGQIEAEVHDCLFHGNRSPRGGAVRLDSVGAWSVLHSTFQGNEATIEAGALHLQQGFQNSGTVLANCIFWGDSAPVAPELRLGGTNTADIQLHHCVLEGGVQAQVTFSPGPTVGAGMLDQDPLFVDPDGPDDDPLTPEDDDLRLAAGSPALDAGDNGAIPLDLVDVDGDAVTAEPNPVDLDGQPRRADDPAPDTGTGLAPLTDLGAYER